MEQMKQDSQVLDAIYAAFQPYIAQQDFFDILYSEKAGYLYFLTDPKEAAGITFLDTPEKMLSVLANEVINDIVFSHPAVDQRGNALTAEEREACTGRLSAILDTMDGDTGPYRRFLQGYLDSYRF